MKLTCDEATTICDKSQYGEASFLEKVRLSIHIFLCKKCGMYSKHNSVLTECYEKHKHNGVSKEKCLAAEEKKAMEKELSEKI